MLVRGPASAPARGTGAAGRTTLGPAVRAERGPGVGMAAAPIRSLVATTGLPAAIASRATIPNGS